MKSRINELSQNIKDRISKPLPGRKAHRLTKVISKNDLTFSNTNENYCINIPTKADIKPDIITIIINWQQVIRT